MMKNIICRVFVVFLVVTIAVTLSSCSFNLPKIAKTDVIPSGVFIYEGIDDSNFNNLELEDFPQVNGYNTTSNRFEIYKDSFFYASDSYVLRYDLQGNLMAYNDVDLLSCAKDIEVKGDILYVGCFNEGVYIVDLLQNEVVGVVNEDSGLGNLQNIQIELDGDYLWIGTFDGVGRYNTETGETHFYTNELKVDATKFGSTVYARNGQVWASVNANVYSRGGLTRYDYETDSWTAYGLEYFEHAKPDRIDFDEVFLTDSEVYTSYSYSGEDAVHKLLVKFNKDEDRWDEIFETTYSDYEVRVNSYLPKPETYTDVQVERYNPSDIVLVSLYIGDEWKDVEFSAYEFGQLLYSELYETYFMTSNQGIYHYKREFDFPQKLFEAEIPLLTPSSEGGLGDVFALTNDGKYLYYAVPNLNDMYGIYLRYHLGMLDIATGHFATVEIEHDELGFPDPDNVFMDFKGAEAISYDGSVLKLAVDDENTGANVGNFVFDFENGEISFER